MGRYSRAIVRASIVALVVLGIGERASAQGVPSGDFSAGYRLVHFASDIDETFPAGWYVDAAGNLTDSIGIVGEFGGNYKDISGQSVKLHTYAGGLRASVRSNPNVVPFGQLLFGGGTISPEGEDSSTEALMQVGAGVDLATTARVGLRVGVDYIRVFAEDEGVNLIRFAVGAVVPFGAR
jgi:hypothetical protein